MGTPIGRVRSGSSLRFRRSLRLSAVSWMAVAVLLLGACAPATPELPTTPATPAAEDSPGAPRAEVAGGFAAQAREALARFDEADAAASAAGEDDLRAAIDRLEALRAEFAALEPPECALPAKVSVLRYMDSTIDLQNALWADDCRLCIEDMRAQAGAAQSRALDDLALLEGRP